MAKSVLAFEIIKWIGVVYLVYLAVRQWRTTSVDLGEKLSIPVSGGRLGLLARGVLVNLTNPEGPGFPAGRAAPVRRTGIPVGPAVPHHRVDDGGGRRGGDGDVHRYGGAAAPAAAHPRQQTVLNRTMSGLFATAAVVLSLVRRVPPNARREHDGGHADSGSSQQRSRRSG